VIEKFLHLFSNISYFHVNMLFILGIALFGGTIGGRLFQKMKVPQVVGYIVIGILLGPMGIKIINTEMVNVLQPLTYFALGLIGFMIGGELKKNVIIRYGKQFFYILLFEGIFSFILVAISVGLFGTYFFKNANLGWGLGLLFGSIASATAPAATTDVLWEYRTRGPLTTTIFGIVALDDALAIFLFAISASFATRIMGTTQNSLMISILHPLYEIGGAVLVGAISGTILVKILHKYNEEERVLAFLIGIVLFVLGISLAINVSMLLASMVLGAVVVNGAPNISKNIFKLLAGFTPPIFILFFVFIGSKLNFSQVNPLVFGLVLVYLVSRTIGKMSGAFLGAYVSQAPKTVRKYLPFCLFSQAGVAIGLSIVAAHLLPEDLGNIIIIVITSTTFVVQLIGPSCVRYGISKAGEIGLNITEEDIIKKIKIADIIEENAPLIKQNTSLDEILRNFSKYPYFYYPVVGNDKKLIGIISIDSVRHVFRDKDVGAFVLAEDILEPVQIKIGATASGLEAKELFDKYHIDFVPVVDENDVVVGGLEERNFYRFITRKQLEIEQKVLSL